MWERHWGVEAGETLLLLRGNLLLVLYEGDVRCGEVEILDARV